MNLPKAKIRVVGLLLTVVLIFLGFGSPVNSQINENVPIGQTDAGQVERLKEIREQIAETEALLEETKQKKATLQNEITYQESQIRLTTLKIDETEAEIEALSGQIDRLEGVLTGLSGVFAERAVETYKLKRLSSPLTLLLTADSVNEFISRFHYLRRIQENDRELLVQMQSTQTSYEGQREKVQELHDRLEAQKNQLARQKAQGQQLLEVTKNDEKKYQELLERLRADAESIARALSSIGAKIGDVQKSEPIAVVGNSGCSTGPHLHFEVFENAKVEGNRVVGDRVDPHKYLDNGQFQHPLPGSIITADYRDSYIGGTHTGIDFAFPHSQGPTAGTPILAAESGVAYATQDSQACPYSWAATNTVGKGVVVDHQNGLVTLYWHIP